MAVFNADETAVQLTLCCNHTFIYGELTIEPWDAIHYIGQRMHFSCYNESNTVQYFILHTVSLFKIYYALLYRLKEKYQGMHMLMKIHMLKSYI